MLALVAASGVLAVLAFVSLLTGVSDVTLSAILSGEVSDRVRTVLFVSRVPRTLALMLAGASMAVAGMIMQMLARNRFAEPSTVGTVESASLGLLTMTLLAPAAPVFGKMLVAALFALAGTGLFLAILSRLPLRSALIVPLVGLMLAGVIDAIATFFAYRFDLLQSLAAWTTGDFSGVIQGRYELLWIAFALTLVACLVADRFTIAGLGRDVAVNLGLGYWRIVTLGLIVVALVTATVVVSVGVIPFLGLIVPNIVSLIMGDNLRRSIPWVAISGAGLVLASDIVGRVIRAPYEIPIGTVVGVVGSAIFLYLLLRQRDG
ncbi:MAG: ABC transporter permease [Pseudomonadota bacterium]